MVVATIVYEFMQWHHAAKLRDLSRPMEIEMDCIFQRIRTILRVQISTHRTTSDTQGDQDTVS